VFKYASSFQRHFPQICPKDDETASGGKEDQFLAEMLENLKNEFDSVKASDLLQELEGGRKPLVVDVREPELYDETRLPGSINIPQQELSDRKGELPEDRDAPIVMVCGIGKFSKRTMLYLKSLGYRNVRSMKGGINEWVRKGQPTESNSSPAS
jgi:rhodanese-related sulfurtransferase